MGDAQNCPETHLHTFTNHRGPLPQAHRAGQRHLPDPTPLISTRTACPEFSEASPGARTCTPARGVRGPRAQNFLRLVYAVPPLIRVLVRA
jgi:hypothetical protein